MALSAKYVIVRSLHFGGVRASKWDTRRLRSVRPVPELRIYAKRVFWTSSTGFPFRWRLIHFEIFFFSKEIHFLLENVLSHWREKFKKFFYNLITIFFISWNIISVQVRDQLLASKLEIPKSDVNREYFSQNLDISVANSDPTQPFGALKAAPPSDVLAKLARNSPYYKRNRPHICSFWVKGLFSILI